MDNESCITLLSRTCSTIEHDGKFLQEVAEACGKIPLAMCIVGALNDDYKNPDSPLPEDTFLSLLERLSLDPLSTSFYNCAQTSPRTERNTLSK